MPIDLNKITSTSALQKTTFSPKFFDAVFTGHGTPTSGLLCQKNNPVNVDPDAPAMNNDYTLNRKRTIKNGNTTVIKIPLNPIPANMFNTSLVYIGDPSEYDKLPLIAHLPDNNQKTNLWDIFLHMQIHTVVLEDTMVPGANGASVMTKSRKPIFTYQISLLFCRKGQRPSFVPIKNVYTYKSSSYAVPIYTSNPLRSQSAILDTIQFELTANPIVDNVALVDYLTSYDLYDAMVEQSENWQTKIDKICDTILKNCNPASSEVERYVRYLMTYNIPLDLYSNIYQSLSNYAATATTSQADAEKLMNDICKQNLNLLLGNTLNNLNNTKPAIHTFTPPANITLPDSVTRLSSAQKSAVESQEPLIMVQAGAGTGKSTLILGRIDYLIACGVKPEDITVLSFTNAAADHITEKNPHVHSMTIARMIHEIYKQNFADHELSSIDTLINSIDIYYPDNMKYRTVEYEFKRRLRALIKNDNNSFTDMNNFVESHYDDVIRILNDLHQTSLELEIIICYQQIDNFTEPSDVTSKYLIIDEVQDNSIFEFVYTLKYVTKHQESLFIVGDCSQTLFEFRASNPRALNILESSGVFATYQLQINYRSTQEILSFANVVLSNIEANKYAQIQLMSSQMHQPTEQEFLDTVKLDYVRTRTAKDFSDQLEDLIQKSVKPYIDQCLQKNEQVTFLAYTRNNIKQLQEILENMYPKKSIVSLVPQKMYNSTIISSYIKDYWSQVKFFGLQDLALTVYRDILKRLPLISTVRSAAIQTKTQKMLLEWLNGNEMTVKSWVAQVQNNLLTSDQLFSNLKENLLQFEIQHNAIKQALMSAQNQKAKTDNSVADADILLSTIHSAKGLEFENVVILYHDSNEMEEDKKRMYYVALTRAMKTEFILAYNTVSSPQIEADYLAVCAEFHKRAPAVNSPISAALEKLKQ